MFSYGGRGAEMWWEQNRSTLEKLPRLTVFRLSLESTQALASLADRAMTLQCTIQDGELMITGAGDVVRIEPVVLLNTDKNSN